MVLLLVAACGGGGGNGHGDSGTGGPTADGPSLGTCSILPANNIFNTPIDNLPVDPHSDAYITTISGTRKLHLDLGTQTDQQATHTGPSLLPRACAGQTLQQLHASEEVPELERRCIGGIRPVCRVPLD